MSVSACGSLKEEYKPMDFVIPDQFLDRTRKGRMDTFFTDGIVAHVAFADPISKEIADILEKSAKKLKDQNASRRHLCEHGRPAVFNQGRVQSLSQLGHGHHRHDQFDRGQTRP